MKRKKQHELNNIFKFVKTTLNNFKVINSLMKKVLSVLLIFLIMILFNTLQVFNFYVTRISGDIDFYDLLAHISTCLYSLGSLCCTLIVWKWVGKLRIKKLKFIYVFLLTIPLFAVYTSVVHIAIRACFGGATPIVMLWNNFIFTLSFSHIYISGFTIAYLFFTETNALKKELRESKYEIESMQLQMLKSSIEPHFLFNNLSILSSLTRKDPDQVDEFIENLADVYRYFLVHNAVDLVPLKEELLFLKKYIALTTKRFGKAYSVILEIENENGYIIPFALQICLENAIKHNEGSEANPLFIKLKRTDDVITVTNPIRPVEMSLNNGLGLSNITMRYRLLFGKILNYGSVANDFVVELPVITDQ